jgi:hypothetical protein
MSWRRSGFATAGSSAFRSTASALAAVVALASCGGADEHRGYLVDSGGVVRLCDALAESYPPQCGGDSLPVEGRLTGIAWSEAQGVRWTDEQVVLRGEVEDGVLRLGSG